MQGIRRDAQGHPLARSILGNVEMFEEVEAAETEPELSFTDPVPQTSAPVTDAASAAPSHRSSTRSRADPAVERQKYLGRLKMAMSHSDKVRVEEGEWGWGENIGEDDESSNDYGDEKEQPKISDTQRNVTKNDLTSVIPLKQENLSINQSFDPYKTDS